MNIIKKGFTLIELLIVIALIGVLAVALLSAINPIEQTRKANDTARKAAASEMLNAIERFEATFFCYPWEYDFAARNCSAAGSAPATINDATLRVALVTNSSELKPEFFDRNIVNDTGTNQIVMSVDADDLVHICFVPQSTTFQQQTTKTSSGGSGDTHVCVPE